MRHTLLLLVLSQLLTGGCGGSDPSDDTTVDPFAGLRDVASGEIECNGLNCCLKRCWGDQDVICATSDMDQVLSDLRASMIAKNQTPPSCDYLVLPEWFYAHDCLVGVGDEFANEYAPNRYPDRYILFVQCFCGRDADSYSSEYSVYQPMDEVACGEPLIDAFAPPASLFACTSPCNTCTRDCSGRECGPDSCGGSCGSCSSGEDCSAAGYCVTSGGGDTCSVCLSTCRGIPSCCTGCGCLCEEACGQCW